MKLVLTSGGISNKSILDEVKKIIGRDLKGLKLLFCTTASNYDGGSMNEWLIDDLKTLDSLGFLIDICDINGVPKDRVIDRFRDADVFYFEGGNTAWLREAIRNSSLEDDLIELLKDRVWIGASAGSCVLCPTVSNKCQDLYDEDIPGYPNDGLNLVNFQFLPHLNNSMCPMINEENIKRACSLLTKSDGKKVYAIDDEGAVFVNDDDVKIISEGDYLVLDV